MFGGDEDTSDVFANTLDFLLESNVETLQATRLTPFPGTPLFSEMDSQERIIDKDWSHYDFNHVVFEPRQMSRETLDKGVSLIVFGEGSRTKNGLVAPLNPGAFRMAIQFGYPIVPMSIVGAYEFSRKGDWKLFPSKITVHMHDTIDTAGLNKNEIDPLRARVQQIISTPVNEYYGLNALPVSSEKKSDTSRILPEPV